MVNNPKLDTMNQDCCVSAFDFLQLKDLISISQTCKRFNQIAGYILHKNYAELQIVCQKDGIYITDSEFLYKGYFFLEYIHKLTFFRERDFQYLHIAQPKLWGLKKIELHNIVLTAVELECLKKVFAKVEHLQIHESKLDGNFHETMLVRCPNLKRLSLFQYAEESSIIIGNGNEWFRQSYPSLESFELHTSTGIRGDELKAFLEINPNIRQFGTSRQTIEWSGDLWMNANIQLDEMTFEIHCIDIGMIHWLNKLHEQGFYQRLKLSFTRPILKGGVRLASINGLEKVSFRDGEFRNSYDDLIYLATSTRLKELCIHEIQQIADFFALPTSLTTLERIEINIATFDDIWPFICQAVKLKTIIVHSLHNGIHFSTATKIIDLTALNKEREKLDGAHKITIYVKEKIYVATKYNDVTNFSLIRLKRIESCEGALNFENPRTLRL